MTRNQKIRVHIVGLGYVGLPLAKLFLESGFLVTGIDSDARKLVSLSKGQSYLTDLSNDDVAKMVDSKRFSFTGNFSVIQNADVIIICVPTPWNAKENKPDMLFIESAAACISPHIQAGQLIVLESSTYPGTTEYVLAPILEQSGLRSGIDFYLAYSPERIDPGSAYNAKDIPKVLGGTNEASRNYAGEIYRAVFNQVVEVSSTQAAELTKLLENTQRLINISLMNEITRIAERLGVSIWEVIEAASTKPYGFTPYYPGPGIGGHCIPVDPLYLKWTAEKYGLDATLIAAAHAVNVEMPSYITSRILQMTRQASPRVLLLGITYKPDVNDMRESPALDIFEQLEQQGTNVSYHDPFIPEIQVHGRTHRSVPLDAQTLQNYDVIAVLTHHSNINYDVILANAKAIFDARYVFRTNLAKVVHL